MESDNSAPASVPVEEQGQWLTRLWEDHPEILALRERVLPWTGGHSMNNLVYSETTSVRELASRYDILELIYGHLIATGMFQTAKILQKECKHSFQNTTQPWDKTDLATIVSLGVPSREDPWAVPKALHHTFINEDLEEDFFASQYKEDPKLIWKELLDKDINCTFKCAPHLFRNLKTASLRRIVVLLVTSTSLELTDDEIQRFFLSIHSYTSSYHFLSHLLTLFDCHLLDVNDEAFADRKNEILEMQSGIRVNVINLIRKWISFHGLFIGQRTLNKIYEFVQKINKDSKYQDLQRYVKPILSYLNNPVYGQKRGILAEPEDEPRIQNLQIIFKPSLRMTDLDPLEVARQISLLFYSRFKAIHTREFFVALSEQTASHQTPTLAEFLDFENQLINLTIDTIVTSIDVNGAILHMLEIAMHLQSLCNYSAISCILKAIQYKTLSFSPIFVTPAVSNKIAALELNSGCGDNLDTYYKNVDAKFEMWEPCIPNMNNELHSVPINKASSIINHQINVEKRIPISKRVEILYRLQNMPYNFWSIKQIQTMLLKSAKITQAQIDAKLLNIKFKA